ncbi:MAG: peptidase M19 [Rhodospirillaceae bacterium]|nr:peptidase M19 [Rhodospirillaceae bacterium]
MREAEAVHAEAIVVDGLQCCDFDRALLEEALRGGVTAINHAAILWENFREGIDRVAEWNRVFDTHGDIVMPIRTTEDILAAKAAGKLGIIMGWQNTSPLEDRLDYLAVFKQLGIGIMQLTYNTQNFAGAGYLEERDSGLTGFGREMVAEMNRVGVLCDLSHVGEVTSADAIAYSEQPCAITHCLPRALKDVARNKSDALFEKCAAKGGVIGVSLFSPGLAAGNDATVADVVDVIAYMIELVGEAHVAIGTDFSLNRPRPGPWQDWASRDKGTARVITGFATAKVNKPKGFARIDEFPNLTGEMLERGWSEARIKGVLGGNWLRLLRQVWHGE